jgi:hypothetical protein
MLREERAVGRLVRERVAERVLRRRDPIDGPDQIAPHELPEVRADVRPVHDGREQLLVERPADDRRRLQRAAGPFGEAVETRRDQALDGVRDRDLGHVPGEPPAAVLADRETAVDHGPRHLLEEEGIPFGLAEDPPPLVVGHLRDRQELVDQPVALLRRQGRQLEEGGVMRQLFLDPSPEPPRDGVSIGTERDQVDDRRLHDQLRGRPDEIERGVVAPVQVLEDDQAPPALRERRADQELGRLALELLAFEVRLLRVLDAEQRSRDAFAPLLPPFRGEPHQLADLRPNRLGGIGLPDAGALTDQPSVLRVGLHRVEGDALPEVPSTVVVRLDLLPQLVRFLHQPALPETRFPGDQQDRPAAVLHAVERGAEGCHLGAAPDEGRFQGSGGAHPPRRGPAAEHPVRRDRPALPLDLHVTERLDLEQVGDQSVGLLGDLHRARLGRLLHPSGDVHRVAHRRVLLLELRPDLPDDDGSGVDADANVQVETSLAREPLAERSDRGDDLEPGHHGPLRIVLVRGGSSEEREDRVAHQAGHRAFVSVHRLDEVLVGSVHHVGPVLGVKLLGHRGRAPDVAEEHRDDAPLPREGGGRRLELRPAGVAEPRALRIVGAAGRAVGHGSERYVRVRRARPRPTGPNGRRASRMGRARLQDA